MMTSDLDGVFQTSYLAPLRCTGITSRGKKCTRLVGHNQWFCPCHRGQADPGYVRSAVYWPSNLSAPILWPDVERKPGYPPRGVTYSFAYNYTSEE